MDTEMKLSLVRRTKRQPKKSLLHLSSPEKEKDNTENKSSTEPCKENMTNITVYYWNKTDTLRYYIYVPKNATVADLVNEFSKIYLQHAKCSFSNCHFGNVIWSGNLQLRMFFSESDNKLYLFLDKGAVFRKKPRSTEWNPMIR